MLNAIWRRLFRLLYNECSFAYDLVSYMVSLGNWRSWQRAVLDYLPAATDGLVLELAHGTGDLQLDLSRAGYRSVALDLSPNMGKLSRRKLRRARLPADLIRGDASQLPFESRAVATIVCTFPTPFIFRQAVTAEMARVLRPSGQAIIVLVGRISGRGVLPGLIRWLYQISGQSDSFLSHGALADSFSSDAFEIASEIVTLRDSAVQLAILTKIPGVETPSPDVSLALASAT